MVNTHNPQFTLLRQTNTGFQWKRKNKKIPGHGLWLTRTTFKKQHIIKLKIALAEQHIDSKTETSHLLTPTTPTPICSSMIKKYKLEMILFTSYNHWKCRQQKPRSIFLKYLFRKLIKSHLFFYVWLAYHDISPWKRQNLDKSNA